MPRVFLDCDDVLADFDKAATAILGQPHAAEHWPLAGQLVKISLRARAKSCRVTSEKIALAIFQPP